MPTQEEIDIIIAKQAAKYQAINDNLPTWAEVDAKLTEIEDLIPAMSSMADAKVVLGKLMAVLRKDVKVTYLVAKNKFD